VSSLPPRTAIRPLPFTKSVVIDVTKLLNRNLVFANLVIVAVCFWPRAMGAVGTLDECNVVWTSPSTNSLGSMPLGNGDVGANVWVEQNGDLLFYVSKVDAYDSGHLLRKLGRVRIRFSPAIVTNDFEQTLVLREGAISIRAGKMNLRVWVDANAPVIRVTGQSRQAMDVVASFETLRPCEELGDQADRLAWGYRNTTSEWIKHVQSQNTPEFAAKALDPILNRTSGCRMSGEGFVRADKRALKRIATRNIDLSVRVLSSQTPTLAEWFAELEKPVKSNWRAHCDWWKKFWNRSHIFVTGCGQGQVDLDQYRFEQFPQASKAYAGHNKIDAATNAFQITQRYALERFCEAAASRGAVPPPYNGSIFTMDMPAGAEGFSGPNARPTTADQRDWAVLAFMWQNTRHPFWAMPARGDFDTMLSGLKFVRDGLDVCRDRCQNIFHHDGAFIMEASWWNNVSVFNWNKVPQHLRYHFLATAETSAMMCDYFGHTQDKKFLKEILLPCADEFIRFYELQFPKRDANGKIIMSPAATVETYQPVTNPNTEITALRFVLTKLLAFDIGAERRAHWTKLLGELPETPVRRICGMDLLAVGDAYAAGREICESPELYSIYPFRQAWLGTPERLAMARQSFHVRTTSLDGTDDKQPVETGGWQAAPVQAAYLGLAREAARLVSINFNDQFITWHGNVNPDAPFPTRPRARFPAFWETKMDGTPDNDHGANSVNALQSMLLQSDGKKIYLLPAWPEDWDVSFKLWANDNTAVECDYRGGKVRSLKVTPESRRADVVDFSSPENRIRTLVSVACNDRNYLFGLPPMLDGLPKPGVVTSAWIEKFGESVTDTIGAPWPDCTIRSNAVYVHNLDGAAKIPQIPAKLVAQKWLTATNEKPDAILKLEFDRSVEDIAKAAPDADSLTQGKPLVKDADGFYAMNWAAMQNFSRLEFTIDNSGYRRGQGKPFELQARQADGSWKIIHQGKVFGSIYSKTFPPASVQLVRLKIDAPTVRRFELF
jgi:alpha-L-fucosidase 2